MYEVEIHITVKTNDTIVFKTDCEQLGLKPIVIETQNRNDQLGYQVMTSHKTITDNIPFVLYADVEKLKARGYEIVRQKIEIKPGPIKHEHHVYYESHLRLKINEHFDRAFISQLCKAHKFHLSKNLFKIEIGVRYQMITYRGYDHTFEFFKTIIDNMTHLLKYAGIECDKVEIEECIYDSNSAIDDNWLK